MSLKIIKAADPVQIERLNLCIYAQPGVGKTTLAFTSEAPLLLDFDRGVYRAANRKDSVPITAWTDAAGMTADDLAPYKTIIIDTAGRALDFLSADIIKGNPKAGRGDGSLTLQGYGTLKARFGTWLKTLNNFGKDVLLIAHMDEQRSGDDIVERLDVQGGSKGEIYKSVDAMGRIFIRNKERVIDFSPRENSFGKNPAGIEVLKVPDISQNDHFLADVIAMVKGKLNGLASEQKQAQDELSEWADWMADLKTLDEFNNGLGDIRDASNVIKSMFHKRALSIGLTFDKKTGEYVIPEVQHAS